MNYLPIALFGVYTLGSINYEPINKENEDGCASTDTRYCKGGASCWYPPTPSRTDRRARETKCGNLN